MSGEGLKLIFAVAVAGALLGRCGIEVAYELSPNEKETITVDSKERVNKDDNSKYMIFTEDNRVFENTDSLIRGKFNSANVYAQLKEKGTYEVTTYGFRLPILSIQPNIVKVDRVVKAPKAE